MPGVSILPAILRKLTTRFDLDAVDGDAAGLTAVHVNRTLKELADDSLIQRDKRHIRFHLDQATAFEACRWAT